MTNGTRWPKWGNPATRGDVLRATIFLRSCTLDLFLAIRALQRGDAKEVEKIMASFEDNDKDLAGLIESLGGNEGENG